MRAIRIIQKNFKLLIRSKTSAFTVLIGPLLIILLVGLAFSGKSTYDLSVGYYTPQQNDLTISFVDSLKQSNFFVQEFGSEQLCVSKIEQGIIHTCIIFPKNFQISDEQSNELRFLVDYSRMNLVYKIIDAVSGILQAESQELSYSLTQILLSKINITLGDVNEDLLLLNDINPRLNLMVLDLQKAKINTEAMELGMEDITVSSMNTRLYSLNETISLIQEKGIEWINKSEDLIDQLSDYLDANETEELEEEFGYLKNETLELYNKTPEEIQAVVDAIEGLSSSLLELEADLDKSKQLNQDTKTKLDSAKSNLASIQSDIIGLKNDLEMTKLNLENIGVTRAETIVSPVNTKIEPVAPESSRLTFTFPFLLVLVIMFVALLLSSTLIIFEKNSKAFFRNMVAPVRPLLLVFTTFITSLIVIVVQTFIILGLANYFLHIPLFKNALLTLIVVLVTTTFFIVLGMAVGYLFSTQEGAIMGSIILGALFMFLSNLVVPLESLAPVFSNIIKYNPYVLASELLRKSLLFTVKIHEVGVVILILLGASLIIFLLIILLQAVSNKKKIKALPDEAETEAVEAFISDARPGLDQTKQSKPIPRSEEKSETNNKLELLKLVSNMTKAEFEEYVSMKHNKIADLVDKKYKEKRLVSKLRKTVSKEDTIKLLAEWIRKDKKQEVSRKKE